MRFNLNSQFSIPNSMSYTVVTTDGFIIGSEPRGEAGKLLSIFTRELGLVLAIAQGIRLEKSKLRYSTREYSFGQFSFVKGREFWRLTDACKLNFTNVIEVTASNMGDEPSSQAPRNLNFAAHKEGRREKTAPRALPSAPEGPIVGEEPMFDAVTVIVKELIARIALLLKRLLQGESAHPELFDSIFGGVQFLGNNPDLTKDQLETLESLLVARMLYRLGYIGDDRELNGYLQSDEFAKELLGKLKDKKAILNRHINKALRESHL